MAGGSFVGGAVVRLLLDSSGFERGLAASQTRLQRFGTGLSRVGSGLTRGVTLPLVAAGAASVKLAIDFEGAMTRVRANTNLTDPQIKKLRESVLDLAGKTGKAPIELAEGLYFLASAGLEAAQVQDVLTQAAKASASGFGEVADIAKLTANALVAYRRDGLEAVEVTDTLAAAIRVGTAEPDAFANALGRILPIAQKAGVGFDEVTASLASLSNVGLDVNEGVTAMRGLLQALVAPGVQATETLKEVGISTDDLRRVIAEDGVLAAMRLLEEATGGNIDKLREIVPNIRAMTGLFGITGQKAREVDAAFRQVIGATGDLDKAFQKTTKDPGFKLRQLLAELQTTAIEIGTKALPVIKDVADAVSGMVDAFQKLPEPVQDAAIKFGLLAIALGPVLRLLGGIVGLAGKIGGLGGLAGGAGAAGAAGGGINFAALAAGASKYSAALGQLGGAIYIVTQQQEGHRKADEAAATEAEKVREKTAQLTDELLLHGSTTANVRSQLDAMVESMDGQWLGYNRNYQILKESYNKALGEARQRINAMSEGLEMIGGRLSKSEQKLLDNAIATENYATAYQILKRALDETVEKHKGTDKALDSTRQKLLENEGRARAYGNQIDAIPKAKLTTVTAETAQAEAALARVISAFRTIVSFAGTSVNVASSGGGGGALARQFGGPVTAYQPYIVGERRPELFVPSVSGRIIPNAGSRGGDTYNVHIHGSVYADRAQFERMVVRAMGKATRARTLL